MLGNLLLQKVDHVKMGIIKLCILKNLLLVSDIVVRPRNVVSILVLNQRFVFRVVD